jgi:hypothetical protein
VRIVEPASLNPRAEVIVPEPDPCQPPAAIDHPRTRSLHAIIGCPAGDPVQFVAEFRHELIERGMGSVRGVHPSLARGNLR